MPLRRIKALPARELMQQDLLPLNVPVGMV
jgi:hypothetical protein